MQTVSSNPKIHSSMRFRKRVKVFPGFFLNFSSSGISSTLGMKGASVNFGKKGTYLNTSIPGTGFYNRQRIGDSPDNPGKAENSIVPIEKEHLSQSTSIGEIKSAEPEQLTSASMIELKESLYEAYKDKIDIRNEIKEIQKEIKSAKANRLIACIFIVGFFIKSLKTKILEKQEYLTDLENQLQLCFVNIDIHLIKN